MNEKELKQTIDQRMRTTIEVVGVFVVMAMNVWAGAALGLTLYWINKKA